MTTRQLVNHMSVQLRAVGGLLWGMGAAVAFAALLTVGFFLDLRAGGADVVRLSAAGALAALVGWTHQAEALDAVDRAIASFAISLALRPGKVERSALEPLRDVGLDESAIHDVVQIVCCFSYMNRLADGTGVLLLEHQYDLARELFGSDALEAHLSWGAGRG